ncbi:MAG: sporulation protein YqfD [Oscillospiraceae bacterium]|nr:sporulation protein YqfD [Oscillospiraceae bacterium]
MILIRLFRRLRGTVRFEISGVLLERFLSLLAWERIPVWDVERRGQTLTGCVHAADYRRLRPLAKKAGVRLRLQKKAGLPFKKRRLKKRHGLLVGLGIFALFLFGMTRFIWTIEVVGNEIIAEETIIQKLEEVGVRPGVLRRGINVREVERLTMLGVRDLGWIALNIDGSSIYVVVNEAIPTPPNIDPRTPSNIVAAYPGQLIEMRVYQGQPMLKQGDAVYEGQVIVSGITQDSFGQNLLRHARADIIAEVYREIEIRVPLDQTAYEETGSSARRNFLRVFGFEAPLFFPRNIARPYVIDRTETPLMLLGVQLPITHRSEAFTLMREVPVRFDEEQALERAMFELEVAQAAQFAGGTIIERTLHGSLVEDEFVLRASYVVHINIARPQEIYLGDGLLAFSWGN